MRILLTTLVKTAYGASILSSPYSTMQECSTAGERYTSRHPHASYQCAVDPMDEAAEYRSETLKKMIEPRGRIFDFTQMNFNVRD